MAAFGKASALAPLTVILLTATAQALSPADKCEATKLGTAGKQDFCRLKAEAKAVKTGGAPDFTKCDVTYSAKWTQAETNAGGMCPSNGDAVAVQAFVGEHTDALATALDGGLLPEGVLTCNADLAACGVEAGACAAQLATCNTSLTTTTANLATCNAGLNTCTTELASVLAGTCGNGVIDDGESCDQADLNGQSCMTQGYVGGTLKCGSGCVFDTSGCWNTRFVDNGDGTVTDLNTGLQWEKKDNLDGVVNDADPHDADNSYTWSVSSPTPNGTAYTDFLAKLNNGASTDGGAMTPITGCFAGHCDWRLPTSAELQTILVTPCVTNPCINPGFGPTQAFDYWSATTVSGSPSNAWGVLFGFPGEHGLSGDVFEDFKPGATYVRAVRGGL